VRVLIIADVQDVADRAIACASDITARPDALIPIRSGRMIARACVAIFCGGLFLSPAVASEARAKLIVGDIDSDFETLATPAALDYASCS